MPSAPGVFCSIKHGLHITLLVLALLIPPTSGACFRRELIVPASTSGILEYRSVGNMHWMSWTVHEYDVNVYCEVLFRASHEGDGIRLEVTDSNLKPRSFDTNQCLDRVIVYDGSSLHDGVLGEFCGHEAPVFESSGSSLLLVFATNRFNDENYRGFILNYSSINRSAHKTDQSQSSVGVGTVALAVICAVILYCILFLVLYRRCKYAQRMRRNLAVSGLTPGNLRVTMTTAHDQTNLGQLSYGHSHSVRNGTSGIMPDIQTSVSTSSRPGSAHGQQRSGRVRHPAGDMDHHESQQPQLTLLYSSQHGILSDNCSGYGSDRDEPLHANNSEIMGLPVLPVLPTDPSGVFYAGNVDEHGILHPPGDKSHLTVSSAPSVVSASRVHAHRLDDDRRSRESSHSCRSLYPSGRNSPRDSSHGGSSGRGSPHRNRIHKTVVTYNGSPQLVTNMDTEGQTFTFYGMIDGVGADNAASSSAVASGDIGGEYSDSEENARGLQPEEISPCGPPPSYEDAATGKYLPLYSKH